MIPIKIILKDEYSFNTKDLMNFYEFIISLQRNYPTYVLRSWYDPEKEIDALVVAPEEAYSYLTNRYTFRGNWLDDGDVYRLINGPDGGCTELFWGAPYPKSMGQIFVKHPSIHNQTLTITEWLSIDKEEEQEQRVHLHPHNQYSILDSGTDTWMDEFRYAGKFILPGSDTPNHAVHVFLSLKQLDEKMTYLEDSDLTPEYIKDMGSI